MKHSSGWSWSCKTTWWIVHLEDNDWCAAFRPSYRFRWRCCFLIADASGLRQTVLRSVGQFERPIFHCEEIRQRLRWARNAMSTVDETLWRCRHLCKRTKLRVSARGPSVLAVSVETWTFTCKVKRRLKLVWFYVDPPNLWIPMARIYVQ